MEYNKDDYKFTATMVIYKGEYLGRADLVKHLNEWWPGVNWKRWALSHYYRDLKRCLESKIIRSDILEDLDLL